MTEKLTPIETKMLTLLSDGEFHSVSELKLTVIGKRYVAPSLVPTHVGRLKKKLVNQTVEHQAGRGYRLVKENSI